MDKINRLMKIQYILILNLIVQVNNLFLFLFFIPILPILIHFHSNSSSFQLSIDKNTMSVSNHLEMRAKS